MKHFVFCVSATLINGATHNTWYVLAPATPEDRALRTVAGAATEADARWIAEALDQHNDLVEMEPTP